MNIRLKRAGVVLTICGAFVGSHFVNAAVTSSSISLNSSGGASVTVTPSSSVNVEITASLDTDSTGGQISQWFATQWALDGTTTCENTVNYIAPVTDAVVSFSVTAPATPGTYPLALAGSQNGTCDANLESFGVASITVQDAPPGPGATAVPALGGVGLGLLGAALAGLGFAGFRRRK